MGVVKRSKKLDGVHYDIRGEILQVAEEIERRGEDVIHLNTGNPGIFGFSSPEGMRKNIIEKIEKAQAYVGSQGLQSARRVILEDFTAKGFKIRSEEDIYIGNGVSELISITTTALLDSGDELLIPAPDYPLWTAAVTLAGGTPVHYRCDEASGWLPDISMMEKLITPRTVGIVIINPNNPTGAVYPKEVVEGIIEIARRKGLVLLCDEIYDRIIYDGHSHWSPGVLAEDLPVITFNGLSKAFLASGFRAGWMGISGPEEKTREFCNGLKVLSSMRLCSNVFAQLAIEAGLSEGIAQIQSLVGEGGRLKIQRDQIYRGITEIPGVSCTQPLGTLYCFPKLNTRMFSIADDERFVVDLLRAKRIMVIHGRGFNWPEPDHFRMVFLPPPEQLGYVVDGISDFLKTYTQAPTSVAGGDR